MAANSEPLTLALALMFDLFTVPGCSVEYRGPTDTRGSRWVAVIRRGRDRSDCYRAACPFEQGAIEAARLAVQRFNERAVKSESDEWHVLGHPLSMDGGDTYVFPVGPDYLRSSVACFER